MTDENSMLTQASNLLGYKSLSESNLNSFGKKHVNEAFEDNEMNYNPKFNDYVQTDLKSQNSGKRKEDEECSKDEILPVNFSTLFRYSSRVDKVLIFSGFIIAFFSGAAQPTGIVLLGNIIEKFADYHRLQNNVTSLNISEQSIILLKDAFLTDVGNMCFYLAIIGCVVFCLNYVMVSFLSMAAANQAFKIRCLFMESALKQDIGWFDTNQTGDFASRLTGDLSRVQDGIGEKIVMCISFTSVAILSLCYALYYGWKLTLVCLCIMPVMSLAMAIISKIQAAISRDEIKIYGAASAVAEEVLSSIRTVVSFGGEQKEIERYNECARLASKKSVKRGILTGIGTALFWFCIYAGYALSFWYGVRLIVDGEDQEEPEYKTSTLIIVLFSIMFGASGLGQTAPYFEAFAVARGAAGKIFSIINRKPSIDSSSESGKMPFSLEGSITLKDVYFNYPARPDVPVLKGVSLNVNSGETVALVGPSGCGKSTVVQLIQRFYDVEKGSVEIDGNNVKELNVGWLRNHIGLVSQEPILFSTTIAENILYGKPGATQAEIEKASKIANVHDFIETLPLKYNTLVGERGTQLSGGQKQRIAIARALIKNPKILLLDEATSALDNESEAVVQSALDEAGKGRTMIIVAHRLSTISGVDKIVALSEGMIKEIGTHDELMERKGVYYQLVIAQAKEEDGDDGSCLVKLQKSISSAESYDNSDKANSHRPSVHFPSMYITEERVILDEGKEKKTTVPHTRLLKMCVREWPYILVGSIAAIIMGLLMPIYGIVFGNILKILAERNDQISSDITAYSLVFLIMAISAFTACFIQIYMFTIAGEKLISRLRKKVFTAIISQDMSWFDDPKNNIGSLCTQLTDVSSVEGATGSRISVVLQTLSTLIASVVIGLWFHYKIGAVILSFIPLVFLSTFLENKIARGQILNENSSTERASKIAIEAIGNIRTVASLHQEKTFYAQFKTALFGPLKKSRKNSQIRGLTFGFAQCILPFTFSVSMYYGSILVSDGEISYPNLFKIIQSVLVGTVMIGQTIAFAPDYHRAKIAAVNVFKLLDMKPKIDVFSKLGHILIDVKGYVNFKNVRFNYPSRPEVKILRDLDLEVKPGQTVGLVGSSGCGKSTCIQLIERFYEPLSGDVMVDGVCVRDMNVANLRSHIGLVSQEPVLFSYSLAENIAYGDNSRKVEMDEIIAAARQANIHSFIASLPHGYHTTVGNKGVQLSGGQKQRVAIARALLRNPKILLLDEATSALDIESEKVVQEALDKASSGRTCLIIAHRLSTIQNADMIAVIHNGRVVEKGTHQELLNLKGHYFNLYSGQAGVASCT